MEINNCNWLSYSGLRRSISWCITLKSRQLQLLGFFTSRNGSYEYMYMLTECHDQFWWVLHFFLHLCERFLSLLFVVLLAFAFFFFPRAKWGNTLVKTTHSSVCSTLTGFDSGVLPESFPVFIWAHWRKLPKDRRDSHFCNTIPSRWVYGTTTTQCLTFLQHIGMPGTAQFFMFPLAKKGVFAASGSISGERWARNR
jgi:hypothetical protein